MRGEEMDERGEEMDGGCVSGDVGVVSCYWEAMNKGFSC